MKKIGIIHTTKATLGSLPELVKQEIPELDIINILDDSILNQVRLPQGLSLVRERFIQYALILEKQGADMILSACSTVGEIAEEADRLLTVPVRRIDEAMVDKGITMGKKIGVLATLESTLVPTVNLLKRKGGADLQITTVLVEGAYDALMQGDADSHDRLICAAVQETLKNSDVLLLAQASMASALKAATGVDTKRILTSPALGVAKLKKELEKMTHEK